TRSRPSGPRDGGARWRDREVATSARRCERLRDYLRGLRAFLRPFVFDDGARAMRKSSIFLPDLIAAANHRGFKPRPAQVSAGFSGLRYLGATGPFAPRPRAIFERVPPWNRASFDSPASSILRSSATLAP